MLEVSGLEKSYPGGRKVLRDLHFALAPEETLSIVGPSGCGKTSLLYLLCGLLRPDAGKILLQGRPLERPSTDVAIILQDYGLLPWKTVLKNVSLGLKIQGKRRAEREALARKALADVGLAGREQDYPSCLSGGEQQRVAIARAYAMRPYLLLLDEPFSSLDALTREKLQRTLLELWRTDKTPYVLVTHSVEEAVYLGRRILLLSGSPATAGAVFENPRFGSPGLREDPEFYTLVREIRRTMESLW